MSPLQRIAKRTLDLVGSAIGLLLASPLLAVTTLVIGVTMGRPIFFRQERPGKDGNPFTLIKFRSMRFLGEGERPEETDNLRLTRVGYLIRATSIDELPTLWNVLKGDMSLVGPRPLLLRYLDRYTPEQARRHDVIPGITGWSQVNGRNAILWEKKLELDVWYVDHQSLWLDLKIIALTVVKVFTREGISHEGYSTMPEFGLETTPPSDDATPPPTTELHEQEKQS